jgi:hypothetical protein
MSGASIKSFPLLSFISLSFSELLGTEKVSLACLTDTYLFWTLSTAIFIEPPCICLTSLQCYFCSPSLVDSLGPINKSNKKTKHVQGYSKRGIRFQKFILQVQHMATCYILTEGRTLKVIFTPYKHSMWAQRVTWQMSNR